MGLNTAPQTPVTAVGAVEVCSVSFVDALDSGELLTGAPTVTEVTTSDLTIANKGISTVELTINNQTVPIGMAVQFKITGQLVANSPYSIKIVVSTDASPAQTKVRWVDVIVEGQ